MAHEVSTPDKLEYQFFPVSGGLLNFKVRSSNDAHIALTTSPQASNPMFEICIGGWKNSKSSIRKDGQEPDVATVPTPGILNAGEFRTFWIRWFDNTIKVGNEGEAAAFMSYDAGSLFQVNYMGIRTGCGATGTWLLMDSGPVISERTTGMADRSRSGPGNWVPAANGQVPPNAMQGGIDNSEQLYIARARHEGELIPGKLHPSHGVCYVSWGGTEHAYKEYEVLCSGIGHWIPITAANIPKNAVPAGETSDGESLFIGRASHNGCIVLGKVQPSHGCCYAPYNGGEVAFKEYEIFVSY